MEKTRKWRKILAMMLTVVMMLQNAQSVMVFADVTNEQIEQRLAGNQGQTEETQPAQSQVDTRANGEEYKTQSQETQENGNGSTDIGSPESGNTTTEAKTSNADVSATITQSVFQADVSETTCNFVQMTAQITNNDTENPATGVSVKALLNSAQLSWVNGYGTETAGAGAYAVDSNNTADLPDGSADGYDQIVMWTDQTIGAGETVAYQFAAQIIPENLDGVVNAWYVDGTSCSYTWENTEVLNPVQTPEADQEETSSDTTQDSNQSSNQDSNQDSTQEATPTPEVTEEATATPTPEVTETPEATPTPEVTEEPTATPTPEVTETPEATPTPEPTQAADEDKQAILDKQDKLLSQSDDRLNIKKSAKKAAKTQGNGIATYSTKNSLKDFIYDATIVPDTGRGDDGEPTADNGSCRIELKFKEDASEGGDQFDKNLTYELPEGITVYETISGQIDGINDLAGAVLGTYTITPATSGGNATMTINFNNTIKGEPFESYKNLDCTVKFNSWFKVNASSSGEKKEFTFSDTVTKKITFKPGKQFSGNKSSSNYIKGDGNNPGYFEFTIDLRSDQAIASGESFTVEDTLGANLSLYGDIVYKVGNQTYTAAANTTPAKIDSKTDNSFNMTISGPVAANQLMTITYKATVKDITQLDQDGNVANIGNTAIVAKGTTDEIELSANPVYKPGLPAEKSNDGVSTTDGKVLWTVTINPNGDNDMSGKTISDSLDNGLVYDFDTPISITPEISNFTWETIKNSDERGWTYTLPANAGYQTYVIKYKTIVPASEQTKTYSNFVSIDSKQVGSSTVSVPGTGSGSGTGLQKVYDKEEKVGDKKYVWWKSTITIPEGESKNVVYKDTLTGTHKFETPPTLTVKDKDNQDVALNASNYNYTDNAFTITFGDVSGPQTYVISYRTEITDNGSVNNTGLLTADGKTTSSQAKHTVQEYSFSKSGSLTDKTNGIITWRVVLNDGTFNLGRKAISVEDTFSEGLEYVNGSAKLYVDDELEQENNINNDVTVSGNTVTFAFSAGLLSGKTKYVLEYQTRLKKQIDLGDANTFTNTAKIIQDGKTLGIPEGTVAVSNKVLSKDVIEASSENGYKASYTVMLNEDRQFFSDIANKFEIQDKMSANQILDRDSLKLYRMQAGQNWTEVSRSNSDYQFTLGDQSITIICTNKEYINRTAYKLTYDATVNKGNSTTDDVPYTNQVHYTVNGKTYDESTDRTADFGQSTSGSGSGSISSYEIVKAETGNSQKKLANAKFMLYKVGDQGNLTAVWDEGKTTDADGKLQFGGKTATGYTL